MFEPSHSLLGMIWQVCEATGWTMRHVLWRVPYPTLLMMMADAPRYIKKRRETKKQGKEETGASILSFFQSHLNKK